MNQPENQSDRATPEDLKWLEEEIRGENYEGNTPRADRYRRTLNSLRAPVVPEGFALPGFGDTEANPLDRWCSFERLQALEAVEAAARSLLPPEDRDDYATGYSAQAHDLSPEMEALANAIVQHDIIAERDADTDPPAAPPAPVVQQQPRAWEWSAEGRDGKIWRVVTMERETAEHWTSQEDFIGTVTPLYALQESP